MKLFKLAVLTALLLGMNAPVFAAIPSMQEAQQAVDQQPQTTDPKVENAQQAFLLAITAINENPNHPSIAKMQAILEKEDFQASLEKSLYDANIRVGDPKATEKMLAAYTNNAYMKQLVDIILESQSTYKPEDVDRSIVTVLLLQTLALASLLQ